MTTFSSIAGTKLSRLATRCLVLTTRNVGREMTLRTRTISTASRPNARSARVATGLERSSMETCLFTVLKNDGGEFYFISNLPVGAKFTAFVKLRSNGA